MIYLKTSIGIELQGEDMLISSLQGNFSGGSFTHFLRISDYGNRDPNELRQEVQLFLRNNSLGKDNVILGIPRRDILLRQLELPAEVADNLKQVIRYQVQSFEPTDEDSYLYDYALLKKNEQNKKLSILLAMVRKSLLDNHLKLLSELGIQPAAVTCSTIALSSLFLQNQKSYQDKTFILANANKSCLELIVLHQGMPVYSQETPRDDGRSWKDFILKELDKATSKVRLEAESTIEQIVLSGDESESVYEELKEAIPETVLLKDAVPLKSSAEYEPFFQQAAVSIGLAFTDMARHPSLNFNMLPATHRFKQTRWAYIAAAVLALVILVFLAGILFHGQIQEKKLVLELDREIDSLKPSVAKIQEFEKRAEELAGEIIFIENVFRSKDINLELLQELTTLLPEDTYINTYNYQENKTIQIIGLSGSGSDLVLLLDSSPLLQDVTPRQMNRDALTGKDRFTIQAKLEE